MRTRATLVAFALGACACGTWSNADLEFLNVLPQKDQLQSQLPADDTRRDGLTGGGLGQRHDGLQGQSTTYQETKQSSDGFNQGIDSLLANIEAIRSLPPTTRDGDRRVWGPFRPKETPDFEVRVVMDKLDDRDFSYRIELHKLGSGLWFPFITGSFLAGTGIRQGSGALTILAKETRANGHPTGGLETIDTLDLTYTTEGDPVYVALDFRFVPGASSTGRATVKSWRWADGSGRIGFLVPEFTEGNLPGPHTLAVTSSWLSTGEGRTEAKLVTGTLAGATWTECWDASFNTEWSEQTWAGPPTGVQSAACLALANKE